MPTILIVDDSELIRHELTDMVKLYYKKKSQESDVHVVGSKPEADEVLKNSKIDVAFCDIRLLGGKHEGVELLKQLKSMNPNCKVFMVSVMLDHAVRKTCAKLGADDFIDKPFSADEIFACLDQVHASL